MTSCDGLITEDALNAAVSELIGSHAPNPTAFLAHQLAVYKRA